MVGAARESTGGVTTVLNLCEKMPMWKRWGCYWLGTQRHGALSIKLWYAVKSFIKAFFIIWKYDIIHFHTTPDKGGLLIQMPIFLLAKLGRKKTIMHIHVGNQLNDHTKNRFFLWWMKKCDIVVLLAKKWQKLLSDKYPQVKTPTAVIYNACEEKEFVPMEKKDKTIVFVGSMNANKAPEILIRAWAKIERQFPKWNVKFMGSGNTEEQNKQLVQDLGIEKRVDFMGFCRGRQLAENFSHASVYVMCSYQEGFPMSVIEAWAYGAAVVTTPVGGLPDVIEEGKNCLTYSFGDSDELAEQLKRVLNDAYLRGLLGKYGHDSAYQHFSMNKINDSFEQLYKSL